MKLAMIGLVFAGCTTDLVQSVSVETGDLSAHYTIASEPGGVIARAEYLWSLGDGVHVIFDDGDRISVDGNELVERDFHDVFELAVTARNEHVFLLERPGEPPIEHRVTEATPLSVSSTPTTGTYDSEVVVAWTPVEIGDTVKIAAKSTDPSCFSTVLTTDRPDTGMFTFSGANLQSEVACEFALGVTRTKRTTVDPLGMASVTIESQRTADPATLLLH